jgi:ribonucleoside-diphosphate reductase alpha chain
VRTIEPMGHVKMMGACQPFLSGAISKTVNMPSDASIEDISEIYMESWRLGLKAVAVYRDGCKRTQPLNTSLDTSTPESKEAVKVEYKPVRRKLPVERAAITHKFSVAGHEGYITVGQYEDGSPGEIFLVMAKEGSVVSGLMDAFATSVSLALQYGVPLDALSNKFMHMRFEPSGFTGNPEIPIAKSIMDYIFRWMDLRFGEKVEAVSTETEAMVEPPKLNTMDEDSVSREETVFTTQADAPPCTSCGSIMVRSGACYKCFNCGSTSGCS